MTYDIINPPHDHIMTTVRVANIYPLINHIDKHATVQALPTTRTPPQIYAPLSKRSQLRRQIVTTRLSEGFCEKELCFKDTRIIHQKFGNILGASTTKTNTFQARHASTTSMKAALYLSGIVAKPMLQKT